MTRSATPLLALVLVSVLAGCYRTIHIPAETTDERLSPTFLLELINELDGPVDLLPSEQGVELGFPVVALASGLGHPVLFQVRQFKVGAAPAALVGREVVPGPYIDGDVDVGAGFAVVKVENVEGLECHLVIDLRSDRWFESVRSSDPIPRLVAPLRDCAMDPLFGLGPPSSQQ